MSAFVFNIAKGKVAQLATLPGTGDEIVAVLLAASGLEADSALKDYDTLAALLAGASSEAAFTGYARQAVAGLTVTVDDSGDQVTVDIDDPSWDPTTSEALGKIVFCYDPDGSDTDASMIPLVADDYVVTTPTSGTVTYQVNAAGIFRAGEPEA